MATNLPQPRIIDSKRMSALTRKLQDMKYNHREIFRRLEIADHLNWKTESLFARLNRLVVPRAKQAPNDALDAAIGLLFLNIPTPRKELEKWLGSEEVSALEEMRKIAPGVRAILASGYDESDRIREIVAAGFGGFLQKPFRREELSGKIAEILTASLPGSE